MAVQKFNSLQEAEEALWCIWPNQNYYDRMGDLWEIAERINPVPYPRGVFKFRSIEEANEHMDKVELERALEYRRRMGLASASDPEQAKKRF